MRIRLSSCFILIAGCMAAGCSGPLMPPADQGKLHPAKKNISAPSPRDPDQIALEERGTPTLPYDIIGQVTVSRYNVAGIMRQKAAIHDRLRDLAASMGGDAIIHPKNHPAYVTATVIAFRRPCLLSGSACQSVLP